MTPTEFKSARRRLGYSASEFARLLGLGGKHAARHVRRLETRPGLPSHRRVPPDIEAKVRDLGRYKRGFATKNT